MRSLVMGTSRPLGPVALLLLMMIALAATPASATTSARIGMTMSGGGNYAGGTNYSGNVTGELARGTGGVTTEVLKFTAGFGTMTCTTSAEDTSEGAGFAGSVGASGGATVTGSLTAMTWGNCKDNFGVTCSWTALNLPWAVSTTFSSLGTNVANGTLTISSGSGIGGGAVAIRMTGCSALDCTFTPNGGSMTASVFNPTNSARPDQTGPDNGAGQVHFNAINVTGSGPNCWVGTTGTWTANYAIRTSAGADLYMAN